MGCLATAVLIMLGQMLVVSSTSAMAACPLDLSSSNFTRASSLCSNKDEIRTCCRYINAFVAISVARYANTTGSLGVSSDISDICLLSISHTLALYGIPQNTTVLCGFGTKIPVNYECRGLTSVKQVLESPQFGNVSGSCKVPVSSENDCKKCVNAAILYLYDLVGISDNLTFSTCRDATFSALASQLSVFSMVNLASCYFGVPGISSLELSSRPTPQPSPNLLVPANTSQLVVHMPHQHYHLSPASGIGIALIATAMLLVIILIFIIRKKKKESLDTKPSDENSSKVTLPPQPVEKFKEGPVSIFRKFSYKETKAAKSNFSTVIRQSEFITLYKGQFKDGPVIVVKQMIKITYQTDDEFVREAELFARLHHRHLVAFRGYCMEKKDRFLMYEFIVKGSLEDHLHASDISPLSWQTRIQIAIDVANALEYLHCYHDPPLCHKDIMSGNIFLDENFVAKVAFFRLPRASKDGNISLGPVNPENRVTLAYMDPEYEVTQELTEKSDVYSYGILLLEIITARKPIQGDKSLLEWAQPFMSSESALNNLLDINIRSSVTVDQLQAIIAIVKWCTQKEGSNRPSIKQVLRILYESSEPLDSVFIQAVEDNERSNNEKNHSGGEVKGLGSSNGTARSFCSRSFLLESGSPQSPDNNLRY